MILIKARADNSLRKIFIKNTNISCHKGLKYCKFMQKRNKAKHLILMKKIILKGNTFTKYIDHKHKNTGTSCKSIRISKLQCFKSSSKC